MKVINLNGDLLNTTSKVIIHQVNCITMGSGVAKALYTKYPVIKEAHSDIVKAHYDYDLLGNIQSVKVSDDRFVINMFAQRNYGYNGERYTNYEALYTCLEQVRNFCFNNNIISIALPYHMSCDRGGADWDIVLIMLKSVFKNTNIIIEIWKL